MRRLIIASACISMFTLAAAAAQSPTTVTDKTEAPTPVDQPKAAPPSPPVSAEAPSTRSPPPHSTSNPLTNDGTGVSKSIEAPDCPSSAPWDFAPSWAWPIVLLIVMVFVAFNRRLQRLLGIAPKLLQAVKLGAVEVQINSDAAKEVRAEFRLSYTDFVAAADDEYQRMSLAYSIQDRVREVVTIGLNQVLQSKALPLDSDTVRATVYVEDIVFRGYLYQLVNYYSVGRSDGGPAGRRFSQRYGIIGQAWRLRESQGRGQAVQLPNNPSPAQQAVAAKELVARWGMTYEEATVASRERPSTLCVVLRHGGEIRGLLYIDSKKPNTFGPDLGATTAEDVAVALESHPTVAQLAGALASVLTPLRIAAPFLDIGK